MPPATMRARNSSGGMVRLPLLMVSTKLAAEYCGRRPHPPRPTRHHTRQPTQTPQPVCIDTSSLTVQQQTLSEGMDCAQMTGRCKSELGHLRGQQQDVEALNSGQTRPSVWRRRAVASRDGLWNGGRRDGCGGPPAE